MVITPSSPSPVRLIERLWAVLTSRPIYSHCQFTESIEVAQPLHQTSHTVNEVGPALEMKKSYLDIVKRSVFIFWWDVHLEFLASDFAVAVFVVHVELGAVLAAVSISLVSEVRSGHFLICRDKELWEQIQCCSFDNTCRNSALLNVLPNLLRLSPLGHRHLHRPLNLPHPPPPPPPRRRQSLERLNIYIQGYVKVQLIGNQVLFEVDFTAKKFLV